MAEDIRPDINLAQRGDREAYGRLVRRYQQRVYLTAYRMTGNHDDANDVAQEAFIRAYRGLAGFNQQSDFFTWLYRIVINVSLNHLRRVRRHPTRSLDEVVLPPELQRSSADDPARALELKRMMQQVQDALDGLSESLRAAVVLVVLEGMSYRDAAEVLGCSEGTVGWRVHEARGKLRGQLGHYLGDAKAE